MADRIVQVEFEPVRCRILEYGVWCDLCLLPAAVACEVLVRSTLGQHYVVVTACTGCDL